MWLRRWATGALITALLVSSGCDDSAGPSTRPALEVEAGPVTDASRRGPALPALATSVKFAVIGDSGRGSRLQRELAEEMTRAHQTFPFDFVVMLGDNLYEGPATADDYRTKFEEPYAELLDEGVDFYAVLGNHDDVREVDYRAFHMKGKRYYTFTPPASRLATTLTRVEFFALDTTNPDATELRWLAERLEKSDAAWKICLSHHPLYSTGRYRNTALLYRRLFEPTLIRGGVDVVFSGHEHLYQRMRLQHGIQYFISGGGGSVRTGEGVAAPPVARTYDRDLHFMLVEIDRGALYFQTLSRKGVTIDSGVIRKGDVPARRATPDTVVRR